MHDLYYFYTTIKISYQCYSWCQSDVFSSQMMHRKLQYPTWMMPATAERKPQQGERWKTSQGRDQESPVVPSCGGRRDLPKQPHWEDNVVPTLQGYAASLQQTAQVGCGRAAEKRSQSQVTKENKEGFRCSIPK